MLVFTRRRDAAIMIGEEIEKRVLRVGVRLASLKLVALVALVAGGW